MPKTVGVIPLRPAGSPGGGGGGSPENFSHEIVPEGVTKTIPLYQEMIVLDKCKVIGKLIVSGKLITFQVPVIRSSVMVTESLAATQVGIDARLDLALLGHSYDSLFAVYHQGRALKQGTGTDEWSIIGNKVKVHEADATDDFMISYTYLS